MPVRLRPKSAEEFASWQDRSVQSYAQEFVDSGFLTEQEARNRAAEDFAKLLPSGLQTPGHDVFTAVDGDEVVGTLWLSFTVRARGLEAFVYEVTVDPAHRGRGYGRSIMEAGHAWCRDRGAVAVGLNVFGHNAPARALYESLGYRVVSTAMKLDL